MKATDDYEVTIRIRNNYLLTAMNLKGIKSLRILAKESGCSYISALRYANLKATPYVRGGLESDNIKKISIFLNCPIEALFPLEHLSQALNTNTATTSFNKEELTLLFANGSTSDPCDLLIDGSNSSEVRRIIKERLSPRHADVICRRFGIGREKQTLREIVEVYDITGARIRQIEGKALRILRAYDKDELELLTKD